MRVVFAVVFSLLLGISCKEVVTGVKFTKDIKPLLDTNYLGSVPSPETKTVMIFDITGVRCNNCPAAADNADAIATANPNKVNIIALHYDPNYPLSKPWPGFDTMSNDDATTIAKAYGNVGSLPQGMIDQTINSATSDRFYSYPTWGGAVSSRIGVGSPVNIGVVTSYDDAIKEGRFEVKAIFNTDKSANSYTFFAALLEDGVTGKQSDNRVAQGSIDDYEFKHVLRRTLTSNTGVVLNAACVAGRTFEKHFKIKLATGKDPKKWHCVAWIVDNATKEIVQSKSILLKP